MQAGSVHLPNNLVEVTTGGGRVRKSEADGLLGINNENSPNLTRLSVKITFSFPTIM